MKVSVLCSSSAHPVFRYLRKWGKYSELVTSKDELSGGDILFLVSCTEIIGRETRDKYKKTLILHASDLPYGRGWSPHIWQILEGRNELVLSLLEAEDEVDTGAIWEKKKIRLEGHELYDEINHKLFTAEIELMDHAIANFGKTAPQPQTGPTSYYPRRKPEDSRLDIEKPLQDQFNLLRVADPERFPCFFEHKGVKYILKIEKDKK